MAKNLKNFRRDLNRVKISTLYSGPAKAAEKVVSELQEAGPSWTGLYSNSWQIEIEGQKSTGTRREGNPQPVKAPKLSTKAINSMANKTESVIIISNLARSRPYAQDQKLGRFRKGQVRNKFITNEPKYSAGKSKLKETGNMANSGRKGITRRGDIGGGSNLSQSSRTAPLDWFPTYVKGGRLPKVIKIELDRSIKQAQAGT